MAKYTWNDGRKVQTRDRITRWADFSNGHAYIIMLIARKKFNESLTNSSEIIHRYVVQSNDDVKYAVDDIWHRTETSDLNWRIYQSVNPRDTVTAWFNLQREMGDRVQGVLNDDEDSYVAFGDVSSRWKSHLHKPEAKASTLFQFDLDDVEHDEVMPFLRELPAEPELVRPTPNGVHVITEPFNYTEWEPPVAYDDISTDGELYVNERLK